MGAEQPTSFPRGKRKQPSTTTTASSAATPSSSSSSAKKSKADASKHHRASAATAAPSSSSAPSNKDDDFLFGSNDAAIGDALQKKKRSSHKHRDDDQDHPALSSAVSSSLPLGGGAVLPPSKTSNGRTVPPRIEALTFGKFARGTKVLGAIKEVGEEYAVVGLPTMLTGYVLRRAEGDGERGAPLTRVLPPAGTIMAFYVASVTTEHVSKRAQKGNRDAPARRRRIELSPWPEHVNAGARLEDYLLPSSSNYADRRREAADGGSDPMVVRGKIASVEDHGCLVDLGGVQNARGKVRQAFLKFDNVEGDYEIEDDDDSDDDEESEDENCKMDTSNDDKSGGDDQSKSGSKSKFKRILNANRIYDFAILASNVSSDPASSPSTLQLSLPLPSSLRSLRTPPTTMTSLSSLVPGGLAKVAVEAHARNGLCVSFGTDGVFRGSIDEDHLGGHRGADDVARGGKADDKAHDPGMWWKGVFKGKHAKFTARILAVDAATKIVRFSLDPHVLALDGNVAAFSRVLAVGAVVEKARVIRIDAGIGALLALPPAEESDGGAGDDIVRVMDKELSNNLHSNSEYSAASKVRTAYVHISKSMDNEDKKDDKKSKKGKQAKSNNRTPEALFARHFSINTRIKKLRILSPPGPIDGIASCATAKSIVSAHVLTHADLKPGAIYENVPVLQLLESGGVLVDLGMGTRGIVPAIHLFDHGGPGADGYRQRVRSSKYAPGSAVTVRCLTVDAAAGRCVLTAKKTLIRNDVDDPIADYASAKIGRIAAGFVSKVDETGLTVTFYDNVHGRASCRGLAAELGVEDPRVNYKLGDAVAARVVDCVRRRNRRRDGDDDEEEYYYQLKLSLKTVVEEKKAEEEGDGGEGAEKTAGEESKVSNKDAVPLAAGSLLAPKRMKVLQLVNCARRHYDGAFLPGYAVVAIKSKFFAGLGNKADAVECKLPYEQLVDRYGEDGEGAPSGQDLESKLNEVARKNLKVGKRVDAEGMVLSVPDAYVAGGSDAPLPVASLRPSLVATVKKSAEDDANDDLAIACPSPKSNLFLSQYVRGYVCRVDERYGAFVRFLDGLTGLIPKSKKGLDERLYDMALCKITALDVACSPPKILLRRVKEGDVARKKKRDDGVKKGRGGEIGVGHAVGDVKVVDINFARAKVVLLDGHHDWSKVRARIHVTMAAGKTKTKQKLSKKEKEFKEEHKIFKSHPFYNWKVGDVIRNVMCVAADEREGVSYVELSNLMAGEGLPSPPRVVKDPAHLPPGTVLSAIVTSVVSSSTDHHNRDGLWVQVCPGISGFVPALELSEDADVLNDLGANYKVGSRIACCVLGTKENRSPRRNRLQLRADNGDGAKDDDAAKDEHHRALELSVLLVPADNGNNGDKNLQPNSFKPTKPHRGDVVVGRVTKSPFSHNKAQYRPPSLALTLRGNFAGRCCITELADVDDWENMPLGKAEVRQRRGGPSGAREDRRRRIVSSDSDNAEDHEREDDAMSDGEDGARDAMQMNDDYPDGKYVKCRVLGVAARSKKGTVEVSLRDSRCSSKGGGDDKLEDDPIPKTGETAHAFVVSTTKMGCFVRLSRGVEGRVILKELSDDFIPDPSAVFPPGRLVVGRVKSIKASSSKHQSSVVSMVDMDMRESVLLSGADRLSIDDIKENSKYTGVVKRVESYGVFVKIDNSDVSGLAHVSECSDGYVKNVNDLYDPGDPVKIMVVSMDEERKRLGFSLKASNFVDDDDSDDEDDSDSSSSSSDSDEDGDGDENSIDSEDEDFATKLAKKMEAAAGEDKMDVDDEDGDDSSSSEGSSTSGSASESSDSDEDDDTKEKPEGKESESLVAMDTNVGFDWGVTTSSSRPTKTSNKLADGSSDDDSSSSSEDESDEDDDNDDADSGFKSSHKARKKAAAKRREEEETSRREAALADGTADDAPETPADFERLVASSPNSSEVWIKYMAFHLSLADIDSARNVANRAFERIEFRQEGEKLNVWTARLTLELKYGTEKSLQESLDRASQQNNPKQVYLRVCELLDKEVDAASSTGGGSSMDLVTSTKRADEMFKKMCKKFKSKKSVWLAHFQYLLKGSRHEEAHALLKRSLQSIPDYKHVEVMSKFAQMEFELGSPERGRTIFNALLEKHPKRMDLLFVNIDKEVKNGDVAKARALFNSVVNPAISHGDRKKFKFSDKQMKSLFKKWYRMEEDHGDEESQERVKEEARTFVTKTNP